MTIVVRPEVCYGSAVMFDGYRNFLPSLTAALAFGTMFPVAASALHHVDAFHLTAIRYTLATLEIGRAHV